MPFDVGCTEGTGILPRYLTQVVFQNVVLKITLVYPIFQNVRKRCKDDVTYSFEEWPSFQRGLLPNKV